MIIIFIITVTMAMEGLPRRRLRTRGTALEAEVRLVHTKYVDA